MAADSVSGNIVEVNAKELLRYHVTECQEDFENHHLILKAEPVQSESLTNTLSM